MIPEDEIEMTEEIIENNRIGMRMVRESDSPLAAQLMALEYIASPFYLGIDCEDLFLE